MLPENLVFLKIPQSEKFMLFIFIGCCIVISDELLHGNKTESYKEPSTWTQETPTCINGAIKSVNIARSFCSAYEGGSCSSSFRDVSRGEWW